jgi:hypothetical protein
MDTPDTLTRLGTGDTRGRQTKYRKLRIWAAWSNQIPEVNPGALGWSTAPVYYKIPAVLLLYTVKSDKSIIGDRGRQKLYVKENISIVLWERSLYKPRQLLLTKQGWLLCALIVVGVCYDAYNNLAPQIHAINSNFIL